MNRIAVIGANEPLLPFYKLAHELGYYIIGIAWEQGAVCKRYCNKFHPVSFAEKELVLKICQEEKIDGITSFSLESALPTVIYVAQAMGLVSNTEECLRLTSDKFSQREAFANNNIKVPQYYLISDEVQLASLDIRYPVIVKPVDSGGSQGIFKLDDSTDLYKAYHFAKEYSKTCRVIIEEFIEGREFSVEFISHNGVHYFLQITDKVTSGAPHFIEMQHHQPADISLELVTQIKELVSKALDVLKIENSVSHTEIKLNHLGELYIIEIGARMGGDYITSNLVHLSTGYDLVDGAIKLACGKFTSPVFGISQYSGVYFYSKLAPEVGEVIRHRDEYPEIVEWDMSGVILPEAMSNADRGGYLIYQSKKGKFDINM